MSKTVTVGVDIGGTGSKFGLVDDQGVLLIEDKISTWGKDTFEEFMEEIIHKIQGQLSAHPDYELNGIGVGAPNGNAYSGTISDAPNLPWGGELPLIDIFKKHFNVPVALNNDANATAVGEMVYGGAKGMKNFVMITLGTGLGSGIVTNGQLVLGADSLGGELGHVLVKNGKGRVCNCGRKGCLETYVSATGLKRTVFKLMADTNLDSKLRGVTFDDLQTVDVYNAAKEGDELAQKAFAYTGKILGTQLADIVSLFNPEAIFMFGGLALSEAYIFEPTQRHMESNMLNMHKGKVKIIPSQLGSQGAAIIGAASLVLQ
ncbi:MAG: ROK family protein [Reichenbachiella sp.]